VWNPGFAKLTSKRPADHACTGAATGAGGDADDDDDEDDEDDDAGAGGGVTAGCGSGGAELRWRFLEPEGIDMMKKFRARSKLKGS
jgi:hypothetical protein